ncbi:Programmed cell death protein 4 [Fasciola hepatica]|uniref:Programmed cell death protein 4 n=1 Tax=Fasciola hepatica TaxID=6192 RepID=A0A4E0RBB1_FASHE|nr:Programmed cell death protein 4 [Fasciola hepatica]
MAEAKTEVLKEVEEDSAGEMTWQRPDFDKLRIAALLKHPHRKKRVHSASYSHSGVNGLTIDGIPSDVHALTAALRRSHVSANRVPYGKNSRKSRDGRRIPSKRKLSRFTYSGRAGGGKRLQDPTDVLDEIELDHDDPDYDSDANDPVTLVTLSPTPSDQEFERAFESLLKEFFIHGKTQDVVDTLNDMNLAPHQRRRIPYVAITLALQHKQTQYELTSELLSDMFGRILNQAQVQQGFLMVLNELGELTIDFPKASEHVGRFIARAMADDILPPRFIEFQKSVLSQTPVFANGDSKASSMENASPKPVCTPPAVATSDDLSPQSRMIARPATRNLSDSSNGTACVESASFGTTASSGIGSASSLTVASITNPGVVMSALVRAENLLTLSHAFSRLDNIWGVPVGPKATKMLIKKIRALLKVYLDSDDVDEATDALLELDSPHFHHELVFQSIIMAIELSTDDARHRIIHLLKDLCSSVVITQNQLALGVRRVYTELPDLQLDVPAAYVLMERFLTDAVNAGFLPKTLASEMPAKPRRRFISESDSMYRTGTKTYPI